ncbi:MAG: ade [Chthonomonadales bacterium]|nr:ade [Chthonomonadales bacterium]
MFLTLLATFACLAAATTPKADPPLAILGATILDGTGRPPIHEGVVVIREGRIISVGTRKQVKIPQDARRIDAQGKWMTPGLIDMHVHIDEVLTPGAFVLYGVTSIRDVGSNGATMAALRDRASKGEVLPRRYWMGRNIDEDKPSWWGAVAVKGPEEVPALLDGMQKEGVDGVKLYVRARADVARAVITEAHRRHLPVTAHLHDTMPSVVAEMGIDNLEHVTTLFEELRTLLPKTPEGYHSSFVGIAEVDLNASKAQHLIQNLHKHHVAVTPTLSVALLPIEGEQGAATTYGDWATVPDGWRRFWHDPYWEFISTKDWTPQDFQQAHLAKPKFLELVQRLHKAGVPIIAGTDTPAPWVLPGAGLLAELQLLVEAGLSPSDALQTATGRAATVLHKTADVGTIRPGRYADLLLLDADPLTDIRNLHHISAVYQNGKEIDRAALRKLFEQADPKAVKTGP